jgi:F-type H+-transporting ATPase subunit b
MNLLALQTIAESGGQIERIARTFGVDWTHLLAQAISFGIVCLVLYVYAYKPILTMLEARRQQIASGLANAEKVRAELARIEAERLAVLAKAETEGKQLIEDARAAAARVEAAELRKAKTASEQILATARETAARDLLRMRAELEGEMLSLVARTAGAVTGKILTAQDHRRLADEMARRLAA